MIHRNSVKNNGWSVVSTFRRCTSVTYIVFPTTIIAWLHLLDKAIGIDGDDINTITKSLSGGSNSKTGVAEFLDFFHSDKIWLRQLIQIGYPTSYICSDRDRYGKHLSINGTSMSLRWMHICVAPSKGHAQLSPALKSKTIRYTSLTRTSSTSSHNEI